ncbi:hypothetical protein ACFL04_00910 [Patescibacteria group bacterium]
MNKIKAFVWLTVTAAFLGSLMIPLGFPWTNIIICLFVAWGMFFGQVIGTLVAFGLMLALFYLTPLTAGAGGTSQAWQFILRLVLLLLALLAAGIFREAAQIGYKPPPKPWERHKL